MSINKLIIDTLKPLGVPVAFMNYNHTASTYVVFSEFNQGSALQVDDEEYYTRHAFQFDVFASGNYLDLVKNLKALLKDAGFSRTFEMDSYEEEMKKYRKILRFSYISKEEQ